MVTLQIVMIPGRASIREAEEEFPPKSVVEGPPKDSLESLSGYSCRRLPAVPAPSLRPESIVMIGTALKGTSSDSLGGGGRKRSSGKGLGVLAPRKGHISCTLTQQFSRYTSKKYLPR
jgi:hypothetical protein